MDQEKKDEVYLNLVLEYIPETVYKVARHYSKDEQTIPISFIKLYMYQLFRSLAYIHSLGICHRDIKPQNLLLDPKTGVLKLCDFGSAKHLVRGEPNVSYICSRYYRAPELIFGAIDYTTKIDVWSAGCVVAELLLGQPIFPGDSGVDQLVEIIKVLGTPTREQIREMNPNYTEFKFPQIKSHPWMKVFRACTPPDAISLVSRLLEYTPGARLSPLQACAHCFFDELREPNARLPNGRPLPPLFNFTEYELSIQPSLNEFLKPRTAAQTDAAAASASAAPQSDHSQPDQQEGRASRRATAPASSAPPPSALAVRRAPFGPMKENNIVKRGNCKKSEQAKDGWKNKNDPVLLAEYKEKERLKYLKKKKRDNGNVKDMTPREHRKARKTGSLIHQIIEKQKIQENTDKYANQNTPSSEDEIIPEVPLLNKEREAETKEIERIY
ncbi:hypothetical protein EVAR_12776_1 [Eumeta japonica]|uniref:Protein kinase domain-containing protein n=1 Tax=Eumeta variegata TaxID=151549 RepID=A0A4C1UC18_EUMVA|nr:hypothetical protein EVAR_12776_1 [Eumeta japonica]